MSLNTTGNSNSSVNTSLNTSVPTSINDTYAVPSLPVENIANKEDKANKGVANGYAPLDATSKVPSANLPVIDVSGQIATHNSATTSVHGIANTANLVLTSDSRLSDSRTPTSHSHAIADVTSLQTTLDGKALSSHTHAIANVTGLQTALDGKQASGSYAPTAHSHAISDVTNLQTTLDGKALSSHTHTIDNVTGLQTALDGKQASGSYAPTTHTHNNADLPELGEVLGQQIDTMYATGPESNQNRFTASRNKRWIVEFAGSTGTINIYFPSSGVRAGDRLRFSFTTPAGVTARINLTPAGSVSVPPLTLYRWSGYSMITGAGMIWVSDQEWTATSTLDGAMSSSDKAKLDGIASGAEVNVNADWNASSGDAQILNKPTSFTPTAHSHAISDVTNLQTTLDGKQASGSYAPATGISPTAITGTAVITNDSRLSDARTPTAHKSSHATGGSDPLTPSDIGASPTNHTHAIGNVTGLQTALDGKQATGNYAPSTGISPTAITGTAVITSDSRLSDPRTPTTHSHAISDITNLQTTLDGKQASGSYATLVNGTIPLTQLPTQNALDAEVIAFSIALG